MKSAHHQQQYLHLGLRVKFAEAPLGQHPDLRVTEHGRHYSPDPDGG